MTAMPRHPVSELLHHVAPLREEMTLGEAAPLVAAAGGGLPVVDPTGRLVGYMEERDLLQAIIPGYLRELHDTDFLTRDLSTLSRCVANAVGSLVGDHMTRDPTAVDLHDSEMHAAELFVHNGLPSLPVVTAKGEVLGVLRLADLIADLMRAAQAPEAEPR